MKNYFLESLISSLRKNFKIDTKDFSNSSRNNLEDDDIFIDTLTGQVFNIPGAIFKGINKYDERRENILYTTPDREIQPAVIKSRETEVAATSFFAKSLQTIFPDKIEINRFPPNLGKAIKTTLKQTNCRLRDEGERDKGIKAILGSPADYMELNAIREILLDTLKLTQCEWVITNHAPTIKSEWSRYESRVWLYALSKEIIEGSGSDLKSHGRISWKDYFHAVKIPREPVLLFPLIVPVG